MLIVWLVFIIMVLMFIRADQERKKVEAYDKQMDKDGTP